MPMLKDPSQKYTPYTPLVLPNRQWPSQTFTTPPIWLSTDLRDGNQSLATPMTGPQKLMFFRKLVECGFKEIEIAYPSASDTDFEFVRGLIESGEIPDDVWIQVLTPAREDLIRRTFDAVAGAKRVIIHMYNALCPTFRTVVFRNTPPQTLALAVSHTQLVSSLVDEYSAKHGTRFRYEYSPETFSQTEKEYAVEVCSAVMEAWGKAGEGVEEKIIFNLPATVEIGPPNHYADQVEYFCTHLPHRSRALISLHPHNDRGTALAAAELGLLASAQRIEGCLFGNGERTGNVDLIALALNFYTQGISPSLDFSDMDGVKEVVESCNGLAVGERWPYGGELVFTAFSGSHQDAIKKGFEAQAIRHAENRKNGEKELWDIPYLPIDPADLNLTYDAVIRVNSQSGKGGIAYLVKQYLGLDLPRKMQVEFYGVVQSVADKEAREVGWADVVRTFRGAYKFKEKSYVVGKGSEEEEVNAFLESPQNQGALQLLSYTITDPSSSLPHAWSSDSPEARRRFVGSMRVASPGEEEATAVALRGEGNGPLSSLLDALHRTLSLPFSVRSYTEHTIGSSASAQAASYVELTLRPEDADERDAGSYDARPEMLAKGKGVEGKGKEGWWGVGVDTDIARSGLKAVLSAANNALARGDVSLALPSRPPSPSSSDDSEDVGRTIKAGLGLDLPSALRDVFYTLARGKKATGDVVKLFTETYAYGSGPSPITLNHFTLTNHPSSPAIRVISASISIQSSPSSSSSASQTAPDQSGTQTTREIQGQGNGPLSALLDALTGPNAVVEGKLSIRDYSERAMGVGSEVLAASFVDLAYEPVGDRQGVEGNVGQGDDGDAQQRTDEHVWGVASAEDITESGVKAVLSAVGRLRVGVRA